MTWPFYLLVSAISELEDSWFFVYVVAAIFTGFLSGWTLRKYSSKSLPQPEDIVVTEPPAVEEPVARREFVDVIMFPDNPVACAAMEMYGVCSKRKCGFKHKNTGSQQVLLYLRGAQKTVDIAAQVITSHQIADCLVELVKKGVVVRVIRDYENLQICLGTQTFSQKLKDAGVEIRVNGMMHDGKMYTLGIWHHKFIIIDRQILMNSSLNFTLRALLKNHECAVFTNIPAIVEKFVAYFDSAWNNFVAVETNY